jgi:hypothetical protein
MLDPMYSVNFKQLKLQEESRLLLSEQIKTVRPSATDCLKTLQTLSLKTSFFRSHISETQLNIVSRPLLLFTDSVSSYSKNKFSASSLVSVAKNKKKWYPSQTKFLREVSSWRCFS